MTRMFLGSYWASRRESIDSCVNRAHQWFQGISSCANSADSIRWHESSRSGVRDALAAVADRAYLREKFLRGRNWTDVGRKLIEELGFSAWFHSTMQQSDVSELHIQCGCYSPFVSNLLILNCTEGIVGPVDCKNYRRVLSLTADAWDPDWAGFITDEATNRRKYDARRPFVDWMLYVSHKWLPEPPPFEPPASVEHLSKGTLIVVQDSPPDPDNDEHQENIRRVEQALGDRLRIE